VEGPRDVSPTLALCALVGACRTDAQVSAASSAIPAQDAGATATLAAPEDSTLAHARNLLDEAKQARKARSPDAARDRVTEAIESVLAGLESDESQPRIRALFELGSFAHACGALHAAERARRAVLEIRSRTLPEDHRDLQAARLNLPTTIYSLGDLPGARAGAFDSEAHRRTCCASGTGVPMRCITVCLVLLLVIVPACASPARSPSAAAVLERPSTGFIAVEGGRVWYEVHGRGAGTPLLVLHGGPGIPHDYLANLADLGDERPVIFYDQLGCGRSERPADPALWTRERFVRELAAVRGALGLDEVVLYGHSWGSLLAVDYLSAQGVARPKGVRGVILAGPALDIPRWIEDAQRLIAELPPEHADAIREGERTGQTDTDPYRAATEVFYHRHVCRADPWPAELVAAFEGMGTEVYGTMNGPTEFTITGPLQTVDVTPHLAEIDSPMLFICGEHDEATPEATRAYAKLAKHAEVVVIEGASHVANYDRPAEYLRALRRWLDARARGPSR